MSVEMETTLSSQFKSQRGFTMIELLMVILLIGALSGLSLTAFDSSIDEARFDETVNEMRALRAALVGDTDLKNNGQRSSFGYLGDIGGVPTNAQGLVALLTNPGLPVWNVDTSIRFGLGWKGPYMEGSGLLSSLTQDAWGRSYIYRADTSPITLTSLGADGLIGGTGFNQDITIQIPTTLVTGVVHGFISQDGSPYTGTAVVELNAPVAGAATVTSTNVVAGTNGYFSFSNVPLGRRSVNIFIPNKTAPTTTIGPIVFVAETNNYVIPPHFTNYNTTSGGNPGTPSAPKAGTFCVTNANVITYAGAASIAASRKVWTFSINMSSSVNVSSMALTPSTIAGMQWQKVVILGATRSCTSPNLIVPCPASQGVKAALSPILTAVNGTGVAIQFTFAASLGSETKMMVEFEHSAGCDVLQVPVP